MIAEEKRKAVLTAIEQVQDETAFAKIETLVKQLLTSAKHAKAGFLNGSVVYRTDTWDAPLADEDWAHNAPT